MKYNSIDLYYEMQLNGIILRNTIPLICITKYNSIDLYYEIQLNGIVLRNTIPLDCIS